MIELQTESYLGPATVDKVDGCKCLLRLQNQQAWAIPALSMPYQMQEGDIVLAIGQRDDWYIIGVIKSNGPIRMVANGDMKFVSAQGSIELVSSKSVHIKSKMVRITSEKLETVVKQVRERFQRIRTQVEQSIQLVTKRFHCRAAESHTIHAQNIKQQATERVRIDGQKIDLG